MATIAADTSPGSAPQALASTTSNLPNDGGNGKHLKQKRARSQLSCAPCRQGKLKCNREKPACDQCTKRNRDSTCLYVPPPAKHKPAQNVKGRIRQLENMVVDLMNQNRIAQVTCQERRRPSETGPETASNDSNGQGPFAEPTPPSDSDISPQISEQSQRTSNSDTPPRDEIDGATAPFGAMKISKDEISYVGDSHWGAILNSISELKQDLTDDNEDDDEERTEANPSHPSTDLWGNTLQGEVRPHANSGLGFMLGNTTSLTKDQLIAAVPEKKVADRLLSLWFNSPDPFKPIIHAPTFQEEYKRFWRNPKDTSVMWLGLLFSIMSLAASFGLRDIDSGHPRARQIMVDVNKYHSMAASAAVLADFTKPKEYTIECLFLYAAGLRSNNAFVNVWLMIGLIVRLALRMGYHRDAKHYPNITAFQGEMRRRMWALISMIDVLISFQLGLPSMVKTIQSDAEPPRNLLDRDFNVHTKVLPPGRGIDELTPCSYARVKQRMVHIFANAAELSHATVPCAHEQVMELDRRLEEVKADIPPSLQMPEDSEVVTDPAEQLMCRFNLDLLYLKTKTVLHRRYMLTPLSKLSQQEQTMGIGISRKICIECALRVLQHHHTIYSASQPGGQLQSVKWYMGSISTHDFLLAAMIICLELSMQMHNSTYQTSPGLLDSSITFQCPRRRAMMNALEKSQLIWADASRSKVSAGLQFSGNGDKNKGEHMFDETERAARAMAVMLEKVRKQFGAKGMRTPMPAAAAVSGVGMGADGAVGCGGGDGTQQEAAGSSGQTLFNGVVSTYEWGDMSGVPQPAIDVQLGLAEIQSSVNNLGTSQGVVEDSSSFFGNNSAAYTSNCFSNDPPPDQYLDQLPDYSMIGDMLDVDTNLNWEIWDHEIANGGATQSNDWLGQTTHSFDPQTLMFNVVPGNATVPGGTGTLPQGSSISNGGFASTDGFGVGSIYGNANMDLDMNGMLEDVDLGLGVADYNRNGMYPATKDEWEDFRQRTRQAPN